MTGTAGPADEPCPYCPFRCDAPSGIWDPDEYAKLAARDVETAYQPQELFLCHLYGKGERRRYCAGAAGCYDGDHLVALRIAVITGEITPEVAHRIRTYVSPVPLFSSGAEAAIHGLAEIANTSPEARAAVDKLNKIIRARSAGDEYDDGEHPAAAGPDEWPDDGYWEQEEFSLPDDAEPPAPAPNVWGGNVGPAARLVWDRLGEKTGGQQA